MSENVSPKRNYSLDIIKFVLAIYVFFSHTRDFTNKTTVIFREVFAPLRQLGWIAVQFFFIISGLLMVNSYYKSKSETNESSGKASLQFVLGKFKGLILYVATAFVIAWITDIIVNKPDDLWDGISRFIGCLLEPLLIKRVGLDMPEVNPPVWYISSMLVTMLFLYYLLHKKTDFFLYVFAPLCALLTAAFMYNREGLFSQTHTEFLLYGGLIRALNGLCLGAVSYVFYDKLRAVGNKNARIALTLLEAALYAIIFIGTSLRTSDMKDTVYVSLILFPIAAAISFSGKSYISGLITSPKLRHLKKVSLAIYLNQWSAKVIVGEMPKMNYKTALVYMIGITAALCLVYCGVTALLRLLWNKKLRLAFKNKE